MVLPPHAALTRRAVRQENPSTTSIRAPRPTSIWARFNAWAAPPGNGALHAVPMDHLCAGQRRQERPSTASSSPGSTSWTTASVRTCSTRTPGAKATIRTATASAPINAVAADDLVGRAAFTKRDRFSADVNWDYAASYQSYCSQCTEVPGWPAISSPFQWLTASAHYTVYQGISGVRRRQESHRLGRAHLSQRQPLVAVGARAERRSERERRGRTGTALTAEPIP